MPLNPIIGACSPVRPEVQLRFSDGEIVGHAVFTKRFVGPPGYAHGGISAMLGDQIVSASPMAIGVRTITESLQVRYRRPLPLGEDVTLWGVCEPAGEGFRRGSPSPRARRSRSRGPPTSCPSSGWSAVRRRHERMVESTFEPRVEEEHR